MNNPIIPILVLVAVAVLAVFIYRSVTRYNATEKRVLVIHWIDGKDTYSVTSQESDARYLAWGRYTHLHRAPMEFITYDEYLARKKS